MPVARQQAPFAQGIDVARLDGVSTGEKSPVDPGNNEAAWVQNRRAEFAIVSGDMPLAMQARLLRVLQERSVTPLGGGKPVAVDFQLVCATHRRLREEVDAWTKAGLLHPVLAPA